MEIRIVPRIIGDDGQEIKEGDIVIAQTKKMDEPSLAMVNKIDTTIVTMTFADILFGSQEAMYYASDIVSMTKAPRQK